MLFGTHSFAKEGNLCQSLFLNSKELTPQFENGHNVPLKNVMLKMKEYESSIEEFVDALTPKIASKYIKDDSGKFRDINVLTEIIEMAKKYEKVLSHLIEHSDHLMMSPRIQMKPIEKRPEFALEYKQAYVDYLETYKLLVGELEYLKTQSPSDWNSQKAKDIILNLHAQMAAAHNRF